MGVANGDGMHGADRGLQGAVSGADLLNGEWWRLLTACFVHIGALHLIGNMFALAMMGPLAELLWGRGRLLLIYLASGLAGSANSNGPVNWSKTPVLPLNGSSGPVRPCWARRTATKALCMAELAEIGHLHATLPWPVHAYDHARKVMGEDYWPYGAHENKLPLETLARYSHHQGLSVRQVPLEEKIDMLRGVTATLQKNPAVLFAVASVGFEHEWKYLATSEGSFIEQVFHFTNCSIDATARTRRSVSRIESTKESPARAASLRK